MMINSRMIDNSIRVMPLKEDYIYICVMHVQKKEERNNIVKRILSKYFDE